MTRGRPAGSLGEEWRCQAARGAKQRRAEPITPPAAAQTSPAPADRWAASRYRLRGRSALPLRSAVPRRVPPVPQRSPPEPQPPRECRGPR